MKSKVIVLLAFLLSVASLNFAKEDTCDAGGVGSTNCFISETFPSESGVAGETTTIKYDVSCGSGFYSCCNLGDVPRQGTAKCKPNPITPE